MVLRNNLSRLRRRVNRQSTTGRVVTLAVAIGLFLIAQTGANWMEAYESNDAMVATVGLAIVVLAFISLYLMYAVIRAYWSDFRGGNDTEPPAA